MFFRGGLNVNHLSTSELDEIKNDEGVKEVFSAMKAFEAICDRAKIKFPVDHLEKGWTELNEEAITYAFGPDFVGLHHVDLRLNIKS